MTKMNLPPIAMRAKRKSRDGNETPIDYIYEQPEEQILAKLAAALHGNADPARHAGIFGGRTRCAHDRHGSGYQQRRTT